MSQYDNKFAQKVLIVDDELVSDPDGKEDFVLDLELPESSVLFAISCEGAKKQIENNSDIAVIFLDIRIPKTDDLYDFDPLKIDPEAVEGGISLIPEINNSLKSAKIIVYSCYFNQSYLSQQTKEHNNIIGFFTKLDGIDRRKELFEQAKQLFLDSEAPSSSLVLPSPSQLPVTIDVAASTQAGFDYNTVDPKTAQWLKKQTITIKDLLVKTAQNILDTGRYIKSVKDALEHGQYERWVREELPIAPATAYRYMIAYDRLSSVGIDDISKLNILPVALYELTAKKVPDEAVVEMMQLAESGREIDRDLAKDIKNKYLEPEPELEPEPDKPTESKAETKRSRSRSTRPDSKLESPESSSPEASETPLVPKKENDIVGVVRRQDYWELGPHKLYRTDPNSTKFVEALPEQVALGLVFAPDKNWSKNSNNFESQLSFFSIHTDLDYEGLLEGIRATIEVTTGGGDAIAVCFCPYPAIIKLIEELGCIAYIAEPDYERCVAIASSF